MKIHIGRYIACGHASRMNYFRLSAAVLAAASPWSSLNAEASLSPGSFAAYELTKSYETSEQGTDESSSSSSGSDTIVEQVIAARDGGWELQYDLPRTATAQDRARNWQFPARVLKSPSGTIQLLNESEIATRLDSWLAAARLTKAHCGRWIFTWNAFRIECDPRSVIKILEAFDLTVKDLRAGAPYQVPNAVGATALVKSSDNTFFAEAEVDPAAIHKAKAESDVAVGEILQKPVSVEAALREQSSKQVSGTVRVTLETNTDGQVHRKTTVIKLHTKLPNCASETSTSKGVLERRLNSPPLP